MSAPLALFLLPVASFASGSAAGIDAAGAAGIAETVTAPQAGPSFHDRMRAALVHGAAPLLPSPQFGSLVARQAETPPQGPDAGAAPPATDAAPPATDAAQVLDPDNILIEGRRRPGAERDLPDRVQQTNPGALRPPPPEAFHLADTFPVPDRWRITSTLCPQGGDQATYRLFPNLANLCHSPLDPYHHNVLKGDRPLTEKQRLGLVKGDDWFFIVNAVSDTVVEPRSFPQPIGNQTTERPNSVDVFGQAHSLALVQTFITGASLLKGMTAYKPPTVEYRIALATQVNYVDVPERRILFVEPSRESQRLDYFVGVQEAFVDYHISRFDTSRYDFVSVRAGIQPIQVDFRGFLFQDNQLGVRIFGNRDNNRFQFNLGAFWRLEKDTNSGLNSVIDNPRDDWVFLANVYRQDFPVIGLTSVAQVVYNLNRERDNIRIDDNGFPARPSILGDIRTREYDVVYVGYGFDGRVGRINLTGQAYGAFGEDRNSNFRQLPTAIAAYFGALEASYDTDFWRFRLSGLIASGDGDPYNNTEAGFDSIFENPIFAGADTSYWIRQVVPFAGGGRAVNLNTRNGILNNLRSSKEEGQSNFTNPGLLLAGIGVDADVTPEIRLSANANHLWFHKTDVIGVLRNQGSIPSDIGFDLSAAAIWRPSAIQNIVLRLSGAMLEPGKGFDQLFDEVTGDNRHYSILFNAILTF